MEIPGGVKAHRALVSLQRDKHTEKSGSGPPKVEQFLQVVLHFVCTILHIRFDYMVFIHGRPIIPRRLATVNRSSVSIRTTQIFGNCRGVIDPVKFSSHPV